MCERNRKQIKKRKKKNWQEVVAESMDGEEAEKSRFH